MSPAEELESAVLALPRAERARIAQRLLASLEDDPETNAAWRAEVRERLARYWAGEEPSYPADEVMKEARHRLEP